MEIKTTHEILDSWDEYKSKYVYFNEDWREEHDNFQNKKWVSIDELKKELYKICDDVQNLIQTHNIKIQDKHLHTLYLGTVNKMLNQFDRKS